MSKSTSDKRRFHITMFKLISDRVRGELKENYNELT